MLDAAQSFRQSLLPSLAAKLKIDGTVRPFTVTMVLGKQDYKLLSFKLQSADTNDIRILHVLIVSEGIIKELDIHEKVLPHEINYNKYPHLADISIPEVEHKVVSLIIGEDVKNAHIVQEVIAPDKEDECSLYAGWHDSHQKTTEELEVRQLH